MKISKLLVMTGILFGARLASYSDESPAKTKLTQYAYYDVGVDKILEKAILFKEPEKRMIFEDYIPEFEGFKPSFQYENFGENGYVLAGFSKKLFEDINTKFNMGTTRKKESLGIKISGSSNEYFEFVIGGDYNLKNKDKNFELGMKFKF